MYSNTLASLKKFFSPIKRPPGPRWHEIGETIPLEADALNLDFPITLAKRHGDLVYSQPFRLYLGLGPSVFEHLLKTNPKNYIRDPIIYSRIKLFMGNSLLVNEGEAWKYRRRIALPAYQHQAIQNYIPIITEVGNNLIQQWTQNLPKKINLLSELNNLTLNIAFKMFCGLEFPKKKIQFLEKAISFCNHYCATSLLISPWKPTLNNLRYYSYVKRIDAFLLKIIRERRKELNPKNDLLQLLIDGLSEETQLPLNDAEVLAEFKTHIITGHETTACALTWMWYLLDQNPNYRIQMEAELDSVLGGRLPRAEDLAKLILTKAIINEALRLYPPIWFLARTNLADDVVNGYVIPAKSKIVLRIYALHRNPNYWERPDEFYPERFLEIDAKRHPYLFLPFGSGSHTCIASHLGMQELLLLAATIAQKFRFNKDPKLIVMREPNVSLKPKGGLKMQPSLRI